MMQRSTALLIGLPLILAACATPEKVTPDGYIAELPEGVLAIAAPYQNLAAVRLNPVDGCYVYRHDGPVESTYLPLRTKEGGPICTRVADPQTAG